MGARIRLHDWLATPLGPPDDWPLALKVAVRTILTTRHPMFVFWGAEHRCLYNDAYSASLGPEKHPGILGIPGREAWPEIWHLIGPQIAQVMRGGEATWHENQLVPIVRHGALQDVYWTYSYGPIHHEAAAAGVGGVLVICNETTAQVRAERKRADEARRLLSLFEQAPGFICLMRGPDHVFDLVNEAYRRLVGGRDVTGLTVREALPELAGQGYFELLDRVFRTGEPFIGHAQPVLLRQAPDGPFEQRFVDFMYQPMRDAEGRVTGILCEGMDVSQVVRARQALGETEARWRTLFERMQEGFMLCELVRDATGHATDFRFIEVNAAWERQMGVAAADAVGKLASALFPEEAPFWAALYARVAETGQPAQLERRVTSLGRWFDVRAYRTESERCAALFLDISERKAAEERQALLAREVDHRAKNALAVVQAALRLTPRDDANAYARAVEGRVAALGRAQTLLAEEQWTGAGLRALLEGEIAPFLSGDRAILDGPPVLLPAGTAQPLAMAVHELATNAVKYGALSRREGRVSVSWHVVEGTPERLMMQWREVGGPRIVGAPLRRGFGSRVLDRTVAGQLGGAVSLSWAEPGLVCTIEVPLWRTPDAAADIEALATG